MVQETAVGTVFTIKESSVGLRQKLECRVSRPAQTAGNRCRQVPNVFWIAYACSLFKLFVSQGACSIVLAPKLPHRQAPVVGLELSPLHVALPVVFDFGSSANPLHNLQVR